MALVIQLQKGQARRWTALQCDRVVVVIVSEHLGFELEGFSPKD